MRYYFLCFRPWTLKVLYLTGRAGKSFPRCRSTRGDQTIDRNKNEQVPSFANIGTLLPFDDNIVAAGRRQCVYAMKSIAFVSNITVVCCPIGYCRTAGNKVRQHMGLFFSRSSLLLTRKKFLAGPNLQIVEINKLHR
jgi:hypothetical protein